MGVTMSHLLSPMDEPLGRAVGNALEVAECVEVLQGGGPADLIELILDLGAKVSTASREQLAGWLRDGSAWRKFIQMVEAQDGDASSLENLAHICRAPIVQPLLAAKSGTIAKVDAEAVGRASVLLGGGRQKADEAIDPAVGVSQLKKIGERVEADEPLLFVHARAGHAAASVLASLGGAISISG
jgi:thymidine phosphorylase